MYHIWVVRMLGLFKLAKFLFLERKDGSRYILTERKRLLSAFWGHD